MKLIIVCNENCEYKDGMLGFYALGYFPSSPKRPQFAFSVHLLETFHEMHMRSPSSKKGFCDAFQHLFEKREYLNGLKCRVTP